MYNVANIAWNFWPYIAIYNAANIAWNRLALVNKVNKAGKLVTRHLAKICYNWDGDYNFS